MIDSDLSKAKKNLFAKAFNFRDNAANIMSSVYDKSGEMFRDSLLGKLTKGAITSDFTKTQRDNLLNTFRVPEHYKAFAQYLTGGTVGNKDITTLPENLKKDIVESHNRSFYPYQQELVSSPKFMEMKEAAMKEAALTGDDSSYQALKFGGAMIPNPNYDPIELNLDDVVFQGKLLAVWRKI